MSPNMYKMQVKLRHGSLHKNIHKISVKFENSEEKIKREILVKKNRCANMRFKYIFSGN